MRILITGASGLIGTALQKALEAEGYELLLASRSEPKDSRHIKWTVEEGFRDEDLDRLEGLEAFIHLAGENVAGLRWTDEKKQAIRDSRVLGTRTVIDAFSKLKQKPKVFLAGSATGFYGHRGDEVLTESSPSGDNFLAGVCREWEAESRRAEDHGHPHSASSHRHRSHQRRRSFGHDADAVQIRSWRRFRKRQTVDELDRLEDQIRAIFLFVLKNENVRGAVNLTSPNPVTNEEFTKTLGDVLYRPTFLPLPEFAVGLLFGEMGDALLLDSAKVLPKRLQDLGFEFKHPELKEALEAAVK
jgi:uncharacterized protein